MKSHKITMKEDGRKAILGAVGTLMSALHDLNSLPAETDVTGIFMTKKERLALDQLHSHPGLFRRAYGVLVHPNALPDSLLDGLIVGIQKEHGTDVFDHCAQYVHRVDLSMLPAIYVKVYAVDQVFPRLGDSEGMVWYADTRKEVRQVHDMFVEHAIRNIEIAYRNMLAFSVIKDCVRAATTWSQLYKWLPPLGMVRDKFPGHQRVNYSGPNVSVQFEVQPLNEIDPATIKRSQNPNTTLQGRHFKDKRRMDNLSHVFAQLALVDLENVKAARKNRVLLHPKYELGNYSYHFDLHYR